MTAISSLPDQHFASAAPRLRPDLALDRIDSEVVGWSPIRRLPTYLDPIAALVLDFFDGVTAVEEIAADVHEIVGVPVSIALARLRTVVETLESGGLLESSPEHPPTGTDLTWDKLADYFVAPPSP